MNNRLKSIVGICLSCVLISGCADTDTIDVIDLCPDDPAKVSPGECGCGVSDADTDGDGTPDCKDECPQDNAKVYAGICGCGISDADTDGDGTPDCKDACPQDSSKVRPGFCGCGYADYDENGAPYTVCPSSDCPLDPNKTEPGICGCGVPDDDTDGDGTPDCKDLCPEDASKTEPGVCGCNAADEDSDGDGVLDCKDACPADPAKTDPGVCGCGTAEDLTDTDHDGVPDCIDACPKNPDISSAEQGSCNDNDSDGDGIADDKDACPFNPNVKDVKEEGKTVECNYNKDGVFEIWTASDFERLKTEIDKNIPSRLGFGCVSSSSTSTGYEFLGCIDSLGKSTSSSKTALRCVQNTEAKLYDVQAYDAVSCKDNDDGTVSVVQTSGSIATGALASALYQSCSANTGIGECASDFSAYICKADSVNTNDYRVESKSCTGGCKGTGTEAQGRADCKQLQSSVPKEGAACDVKTAVELCQDGKILYCDNGNYRLSECMDGCSPISKDSTRVSCIKGSKQASPLIKVKMMRDIDMAESLKNRGTDDNCKYDWKPIDLYRTDFDGNHKHIRAARDYKSQRCTVSRPLFENIVESKVYNLNLDYDMKGRIAGALANYVGRSTVDKIAWTGSAEIGKSMFGEFYKNFGGIIANARSSVLSNLSAEGSFINNSALTAGGILGKASQVRVSNISAKFDNLEFRYYSVSAAGIQSIADRSILNGMRVDVDKMIYGFASASSGIFNINDTAVNIDGSSTAVDIHIGSLEHTGNQALNNFYGFTSSNTQKNVFNDIHLAIDNADISEFFGIAKDGSSEFNRLKVKFGSFNISNSFRGLFQESSNTLKITDSTVEIKEINCNYSKGNIFGLGTINGKISGSTFVIDRISNMCHTNTKGIGDINGEVSNSSFSVKNISSQLDAEGIGSLKGSYKENVSFNVGDVESTQGSAYGIGWIEAVLENVSFSVGNVNASAIAYGVCSTLSIDKASKGVSFKTGNLESADGNIYGLADTIKTSFNDLSFAAGDMTSQNGTIYGVTMKFDTGMAIIPSVFNVDVKLGNLFTAGDIVGFSSNTSYASLMRNVDISIESMISSKGNVSFYDEFRDGAAFENVNWHFGRIIAPNAHIIQNVYNQKNKASINGLAVYADTYTSNDFAFINTLKSNDSGMLGLANSAISLRSHTVKDIDDKGAYTLVGEQAAQNLYSTVDSTSENHAFSSVFWRQSNPDTAPALGFAPFVCANDTMPITSAMTVEAVVDALNSQAEGWKTKEVTEDGKKILIPWHEVSTSAE